MASVFLDLLLTVHRYIRATDVLILDKSSCLLQVKCDLLLMTPEMLMTTTVMKRMKRLYNKGKDSRIVWNWL